MNYDYELKIKSCYFKDVLLGKKDFEVRYNDRNFKIGDIVKLVEINENKEITNNFIIIAIKYILDFPIGVKDGYTVFGFKRVCYNIEKF